MIAILLLGILLSVLSAVALWRQIEGDGFSIGKMIFLVWLPGAAGGLMVVVGTVLLVAKAIKGM